MAEKRLWHVSIEGECYVWAATREEAEDEAQQALSSYSAEEAGLDSFYATEIKSERNATVGVSKNWLDSIPFGTPPEGFEDMSVEDILMEMPVPEAADPNQLMLLALEDDRPVSPEEDNEPEYDPEGDNEEPEYDPEEEWLREQDNAEPEDTNGPDDDE